MPNLNPMSDEKQTILESNRQVLVVFALSILVLLIYTQTSGFQYINYDDSYYVYENQVVKSGLSWETVKWAFSAFYAANWHPLTWISLAADVSLWGVVPGAHHIVNVVLHLLNSVLAFFVFRQMTGRFWPSFAIAAFFAVHPTHVESVAWVAERKDVLSTLFWLLSMWCYVKWAQSGAKPMTRLYLAGLVFFAAGLMSKPMLVTLPFVLILCDIWPLDRVGDGRFKGYIKLATEKIPFFVLSLISVVITIFAQRSAEAIHSLESISMNLRIENALLSYAKYVLMVFWPTKLAVLYPYDRNLSLIDVTAAALFLIAVTAFCMLQFENRKYLLVGWLWFLGTLIPVIGLVQVGLQSLADRYTYIPYFGLFVMVVFGASEIFESFEFDKRILIAVGAIAIAILSILSFIQTRKWSDNETLYVDTLAVTRDNYVIAQNLCVHLVVAQRLNDAEQYCRASVDIRPDYYPAVNGMGMVRFGYGDYAQAELDFAKAISLAPRIVDTYSNLAMSQMLQGKTTEAEATLEKAAKISDQNYSPKIFIPALRSLAIAYSEQDNYQKAFENLSRILYLTPDDLDARMNLTFALIKLQRFDEAELQTGTILRADPNNAKAHYLYGLVLMGRNRPGSAIAEFETAIRLKPDFEDAKRSLHKARGEK